MYTDLTSFKEIAALHGLQAMIVWTDDASPDYFVALVPGPTEGVDVGIMIKRDGFTVTEATDAAGLLDWEDCTSIEAAAIGAIELYKQRCFEAGTPLIVRHSPLSHSEHSA